MNTAIRFLPLILLGVLLNAGAQILLKRGMLAIGNFAFAWRDILSVIPKILSQPLLYCGFGLYGISVFIWMAVLSRVEVSFAYPMLSFGYIAVLAYGYFLGNEAVGWNRVAGTALICIGVFLIFRPSTAP